MPGSKPQKKERFLFDEIPSTSLLPVVDIFNNSESPRSILPPQPSFQPKPVAMSKPKKPQFQEKAMSGIHNLYKAYSDKKKLDYEKKKRKQKINAMAHVFSFKTFAFVVFLLLSWKLGPGVLKKIDQFKSRQSKAIEKNIDGDRHLNIDAEPAKKVFRSPRKS